MAAVVPLRPAAAAQQRARELTHAVGMAIALGSWAMMFGALFFVYLGLRAQALSWPPPGLGPLPLGLPLANTVVLLASSATLVHAQKRLRAGQRQSALYGLAVTLLLGLGFVALQLLLWRSLWGRGITTSTGTLGTVVYALTSLHALHVAAGIVVLGWLVRTVWRHRTGGAAELERRALTLRLCGMFWHFVDGVWVVMFLGMFVL
jgi:heme/copper-type cytochrome/quinol oxidase subunit 3